MWMIPVKHLKQFRESLVGAGIPLLTILQEKRLSREIFRDVNGEVTHDQCGQLSGFHVAASHESGGAFCASTNDTRAGLAGVADVIISPHHTGETPLSEVAIHEAIRKLGQECEINGHDHELAESLLDELPTGLAAELRIWDRYIEAISVDSFLRNDRQKFYALKLSAELGDRVIEDQCVARSRSAFRREAGRLVTRLQKRKSRLEVTTTPLEAGIRPLVFTPFAAAQFVLMFLSNCFILHGPVHPAFFERLLGRQVSSPILQLVDDPTLDGVAGSFALDEQGNPGEHRTLLKDGAVAGFISNAVLALKYGIVAGPCRADRYVNEPVPAFSNLILRPGDGGDCQKMMKHLGEGILVHSLAQPWLGGPFATFQVELETADIFRDGGDVLEPQTRLRVEGDLQQMLERVVAVGRDLESYSGYFLQPGRQCLPQGFAAPSIGFEAIHVDAC